jgi:fructosamine-3-kinase
MTDALQKELEIILGTKPRALQALSGGCIGEVYRVYMPDNSSVVAKVADGTNSTLEPEGYMLRYLKTHSRLPVPEVFHSSSTLLVMAFIEGNSSLSAKAEQHAAELLADLHSIRGAAFGLEGDTLIGGLHQPNPLTDSWIAFFRDQRLLYMAREAARTGRLPAALLKRLETFSAHLDKWLHEPDYPSLIHGDMWTTNILARNDRITGFLDPAIYYAHPEIELAFSTLFNTFDRDFFRRYHELRPIEAGFFEERRDIYNLYPLLVHVRLFGGMYASAVGQILGKFGY